MSGLVFADLDQRRSKLMEDIETQIRENKSLRAEADRVASTNVIFQKHLQESRQLMVSLTSQITAAEQRKATCKFYRDLLFLALICLPLVVFSFNSFYILSHLPLSFFSG